jgi:cytidine deaminase
VELDREALEKLIDAAAAVRANAHAPYSGFAVGAALLSADHRLFVGCNVENASFGLSVCAERNAIAAAVAAGAVEFQALAVVTETSPPAAPCGACRQVLAEFGDLPIVLVNPAGERRFTSLADLHPEVFRGDSLRQN